jgi:hypothetical protein
MKFKKSQFLLLTSQGNNADDKYDVRIEGNIIRMKIEAFKIVSLKINF